jgi:hypothetical protein
MKDIHRRNGRTNRAPSKIVHLLAQNQNAVVKVLFPQNMSSTPVEQLHRYVIVSELARGKVVLEIGLGEGVVQTLSRQQDQSWVWT